MTENPIKLKTARAPLAANTDTNVRITDLENAFVHCLKSLNLVFDSQKHCFKFQNINMR